jgi:hypothetical protein
MAILVSEQSSGQAIKAKDFVELAAENRLIGFPTRTSGRYGASQFLQLRQDCGTGTAPAREVNFAEVCQELARKIVDAAVLGASLDSDRHPLATFVDLMDYRPYQDRTDVSKGELAVALYVNVARGNLSKSSPLKFVATDKKDFPTGQRQSPVFTTYKGMSYDAAFTKVVIQMVRDGRQNLETIDAATIHSGFAADIAAKCHVDHPDVTHDDCRAAGAIQGVHLVDDRKRGGATLKR